jgi:putative solute:sodium symporter small subunit
MSNKVKHWENTTGLMLITLAIWFFFGYIIFMFGSDINSASFLGYPLAYYMCAQGSIIAFVVLIFWFANKQEKIDEEFGFAEKGDD